VPDGLGSAALAEALRARVPHLFSALLGFAVIGRFWLGHHALFDRIRVVDRPLLLLNLLLLAPVALIPAAAGLIADYGDTPRRRRLRGAGRRGRAARRLAVGLAPGQADRAAPPGRRHPAPHHRRADRGLRRVHGVDPARVRVPVGRAGVLVPGAAAAPVGQVAA